MTFNSGDTEQSFTFTATEDDLDDDDESVKLTFGTLPTGVSAGSAAEATVSITDDDVPGVTASFEQATYTVAEGSNVTVKVKLSADPERTVTIPLTATGQDGATDSDYSGVPADLTFNSGDTEKSITFSAVTDGDNDDGENVKLTFGTLPTGVSAGTTAETTVSIHRRRRSVRGSELRAGNIHRGRGRHGAGHGHPERGSRAHGDRPADCDWAERGNGLGLLRRRCERGVRQR